MTKYTSAAIFVSLFAAAHSGACTSADPSGSGGNAGSDDGSSDDGSSDDDGGFTDDDGSSSGETTGGTTTGGSTTGTTGAGGSSSECGALASWDECDECECNKNEVGCTAWYQLEDEHCYCGASAPCAAQCTAYCGGADEDPACDACAEMLDEACYEAAFNACMSDADCLAYSDASDASCENLR